MELLKYRGAEAGKHIDLKLGPEKKYEIPDKKMLDSNDKYSVEFIKYTSSLLSSYKSNNINWLQEPLLSVL